MRNALSAATLFTNLSEFSRVIDFSTFSPMVLRIGRKLCVRSSPPPTPTKNFGVKFNFILTFFTPGSPITLENFAKNPSLILTPCSGSLANKLSHASYLGGMTGMACDDQHHLFIIISCRVSLYSFFSGLSLLYLGTLPSRIIFLFPRRKIMATYFGTSHLKIRYPKIPFQDISKIIYALCSLFYCPMML